MGPPFRAGRVIGRSFLLWLRSLPLLFALVLLVNLPYVAYTTYEMLHPPAETDFEPYPENPTFWQVLVHSAPDIARWGRRVLLYSLFARLSQAAVILAIYRRLRGEKPSFLASLRGGLRRWVPVVRVTLALVAMEFVLRVVMNVAWTTVLFRASWRMFDYQFLFFAWYAIVAVVLLLLVPFWVAVPAAVVDRGGSFLRRSWALTRGCRLRVFGVVLFAQGIEWGIDYFVWPIQKDMPRLASAALGWAQNLLLISFGAVLAVVGYRALRLNKEGLDVTQLEEIFG